MVEDRKRSLTPSELAEVLNRLDKVMEEAAGLRREVERQMAEQRTATRAIAPARRPKRRRSR